MKTTEWKGKRGHSQGAPDCMELEVSFIVNGKPARVCVEARRTLADVIRTSLGLTGTHVGCEHGVCGACTVLLDGLPVRSCIMLAVQAQGHEIITVEGLAPSPDRLHPLQELFLKHSALQCGFCTPGFLMLIVGYMKSEGPPHEKALGELLSSNLCRCTGYGSILQAAREFSNLEGG
jgi:carbon-monoxide dehydrogenase small subunit